MMLPMSSTQTYLRIFTATGLGVDLHGAQVGAVREVEVDRVVRRVGVERRLDAVGQVVRREGRERDLGDRHALVGALDAEAGRSVNSRSSTEASSRCAAIGLAFSITLSAARTSASPPTTSEREP